MSGARAAMLPDGRRLHLQHGPIDLIIEAFGEAHEIRSAYVQAVARFQRILEELVAELPALRRPVDGEWRHVCGSVARRMIVACERHHGAFITPMAAVAGAVADEILQAMLTGRSLRRAYVNDGGDIALYLAPGERFEVGIVAEVDRPRIAATATIEASVPVRGIATSGQGGRSLSLGIADAVTVLAGDGASADAAATLIANAVDTPSSSIVRRPARSLHEDSDLCDLPVVVAVGPLSDDDVNAALDAGCAEAERMRTAGLIEGAYLSLRGRHRTSGLPAVHAGVKSMQLSLAEIGSGRAAPLRGRELHNMTELVIRKLIVIVEETRREMGQDISPPARKAAAVAVIANPCSDRYVENLEPLMAIGEELGGLLGDRAVAALGVAPAHVESYGKAAIVGERGELEHAAAILHPRLGAPLRKAVQKGAALVPSAKKMGSIGASIDVPLGHKDAAFVRSHFDAMEVRVPDAPRGNEIVVAIVVTDSGRPLPRVGGLGKDQIKGEDGLR